jgi:hypothetical protein
MRKSLIALSFTLAFAAFAGNSLFTGYEAVRQNLLKGSLKDVQASAAKLAVDARAAKKVEVAKAADAVAKAADLAAARKAFGAVSDQMIAVRNATNGARPSVYYCPMVKQSWLQPKGDVGNPFDASMASCGMLKDE